MRELSGFVRSGYARGQPDLSENRKRWQTTLAPMPSGLAVRACFPRAIPAVLTFLNLLQLILYIPLLALLGQGLLYVLAGGNRDSNVFYRLLQLLSKPFTALVRRLTPAKVGDHQVPFVTFFALLIVYFVVTFERIDLCLKLGLEQCQ